MELDEPGSATGEQMTFLEFPYLSITVFLICELEKEQVTLMVSLSFRTVNLLYIRYFQQCLAFNLHSSHLECFVVFFFNPLPPPPNPLPMVGVTAKGQIPSSEEKQFVSP